MLQRNVLRSTLAITVLALTGCAGAGRIYQADSVKPVRNVAVISVEVVQPAEFDIMKPKGESTPGGLSSASFALAEGSAHVKDFYEDLAKALKSQHKWNVSSTAKVAENPAYKKYVSDTTEGFQSSTPIPNGMTRYRAPNMLSFDGANKIGMAGRDQLMDALKVDAVVIAQYNIALSGTTVMGIGNRYPTTSLRFAMYRKGVDAPVWRDIVEGEKMDESVGKTGITLNFQKLHQLSLKSAQKAYSELQNRTTLPQ